MNWPSGYLTSGSAPCRWPFSLYQCRLLKMGGLPVGKFTVMIELHGLVFSARSAAGVAIYTLSTTSKSFQYFNNLLSDTIKPLCELKPLSMLRQRS